MSFPAAVLRIPKQKFDSPEQLAFARVISCNPWHCIPEPRPPGNQSRARLRLCKELSVFRQTRNHVEHHKPAGDETFAAHLDIASGYLRSLRGMNRKEQIRRYKETPRPMGIFCVRNVVSRKALVGSSVDLPAMLNRQRFQLEHGSHPNRRLQNDWNALGADAFRFETLDALAPSQIPDRDPHGDLRALEEMWRDTISQTSELY